MTRRFRTTLYVGVSGAILLAAALIVGGGAASASGSSYDFNGPTAIAASNGYVFVANFSGKSVTAFNAATGNFVRMLSGKAYGFDIPTSVVISGKDAFVADDNTSSITEFKTATGALVRTIKVSAQGLTGISLEPEGVAVNGEDLFVVSSNPGGAGCVFEFNTGTGALVRIIKGTNYDFKGPESIAFSGGNAFVVDTNQGPTSAGAGLVTEFNAATGALVRVIKGASYKFSLVQTITVVGTDAFVGGVGDVTEFNTITGALVRVLGSKAYSAFSGVSSMAVRGPDAFVTNTYSASGGAAGNVSEFNVATGAVVRVFSGGAYHLRWPTGITISGVNAFITNADNNTVTEINTSTGKLVRVLSNTK